METKCWNAVARLMFLEVEQSCIIKRRHIEYTWFTWTTGCGKLGISISKQELHFWNVYGVLNCAQSSSKSVCIKPHELSFVICVYAASCCFEKAS